MPLKLKLGGMVLLGFAIILFAIFVPFSMRLELYGRPGFATVIKTFHLAGRFQYGGVRYTFDGPDGTLEGLGLTRQASYVGSQISVIYLPGHPPAVVPADDPASNPMGSCYGIIAGVFVMAAGLGTLTKMWALERGHRKTLEHERDILESHM